VWRFFPLGRRCYDAEKLKTQLKSRSRIFTKCFIVCFLLLRGTEEHLKQMGRVDIINSTLGKALGGAAGISQDV